MVPKMVRRIATAQGLKSGADQRATFAKIAKPPAIFGCRAAPAIALIAKFLYERIGTEVGFIKVILT